MDNPFATDRELRPLASFRELKPCSMVFERPDTLPAEWCEEMIRRFEQSPELQQAGRVGQTAETAEDVKRSTDLVVSGRPEWRDVDEVLFRCMGAAMSEFRNTFAFFRSGFKDLGYQIQRYLPGEYYHWHVDGGSHDFSARQLVAIWYLNDVPGPGGETEFIYQQLSVRPEQGKMILFPPFWTHEHRSRTLVEGVKYIATTWVVFR